MATITRDGELVLGPDEHWDVAAKCAEDPELMYPGEKDYRGIQEAKALCRTCPVIDRCLQAALDRNEPYGIAGGMDPDERRALQNREKARRYRKAQKAAA